MENTADLKSYSPRTQWGKLVIYLREHNNIALHIACGDITEVDVEDGVFKMYTTQDYIIELLSNEENQKQLASAFKWLGYEKFELVKKEKQKGANEDIAQLKKYFGNEIKIKEK
ncbi:MAG: hypothetical protein IJA69_04225 [Clostridia bacterium]|nr:hypothetical protein [Clostridia bacterium]